MEHMIKLIVLEDSYQLPKIPDVDTTITFFVEKKNVCCEGLMTSFP
jgi:hypothetical protein